MFNQNNYKKRTKKISKARLNWHDLAKAQKEQLRINKHQIDVNRKQDLLNENFDERLRALETAQQAEAQGIYQRLRAWLLG